MGFIRADRRCRNAFDRWFNVVFGGIDYDKQLKRMRERDGAGDVPTSYEKR